VILVEFKTTEAHRKASQRYRKENKETERINSYRRTAKLYLTKHSNYSELLEFQKYIFDRMNQIIDSPEITEDERLELIEIYRKLLAEFKKGGN